MSLALVLCLLAFALNVADALLTDAILARTIGAEKMIGRSVIFPPAAALSMSVMSLPSW